MGDGEGVSGGASKIPVAVVTGSRAEFGLLERTIALIERSAVIEPRVIAAGMHLVEKFGATVREVEARFPIAERVFMHPPEDSPRGMALAVAAGIDGFSRAFARLRPRLLLVLGDRTEPLAAALAAVYAGVPIAHIHGGDASGNAFDDFHRDVISRAARLHLPATARSAARLRTLGVEGDIEICGAPGLDALITLPPCPREEILGGLGLPSSARVIAVVYHPVPAAASTAGEEAEEILAAVEDASGTGAAAAVIYPNSDAGHQAVIEAIEKRREHPAFRIFPSLPRERFIQLLRHSEALVGNSSAGVIESVSCGLPAVNVGPRQRGRERNPNVVDAPADRAAVRLAIERARTDEAVGKAAAGRVNLYGDGHAAERIAGALERFLGAGAAPRTPPREIR